MSEALQAYCEDYVSSDDDQIIGPTNEQAGTMQAEANVVSNQPAHKPSADVSDARISKDIIIDLSKPRSQRRRMTPKAGHTSLGFSSADSSSGEDDDGRPSLRDRGPSTVSQPFSDSNYRSDDIVIIEERERIERRRQREPSRERMPYGERLPSTSERWRSIRPPSPPARPQVHYGPPPSYPNRTSRTRSRPSSVISAGSIDSGFGEGEYEFSSHRRSSRISRPSSLTSYHYTSPPAYTYNPYYPEVRPNPLPAPSAPQKSRLSFPSSNLPNPTSTSIGYPPTSSSTQSWILGPSLPYPISDDVDTSTHPSHGKCLNLFAEADRDGKGEIEAAELYIMINTHMDLKVDTTVEKLVRLFAIRNFSEVRNPTLNFEEFFALWRCLEEWRSVFERTDEDKDGLISHEELRNAIRALGYNLTSSFLEIVFRIFNRRKQVQLGYQVFVDICIGLKRMADNFKHWDQGSTGHATISFENYISDVFLFHTEMSLGQTIYAQPIELEKPKVAEPAQPTSVTDNMPPSRPLQTVLEVNPSAEATPQKKDFDQKPEQDTKIQKLQSDLAEKDRYISRLEERLLNARRSSISRLSMSLSHKLGTASEGGGPNEPETHIQSIMWEQDLQLNNWKTFLPHLPEDFRDQLDLREVFGSGLVWTCTPSDSTPIDEIPLTIAGRPVVIPVEYRYPLMSATTPPPDPHPHFIDPSITIDEATVNDIFNTFEKALGFYLFINGMLQVIVPDGFDFQYAVSHRPNEFGGLKVSYINQDMIPTAETSAESSNSTSTVQPASPTQTQRYASTIGSSRTNISQRPNQGSSPTKLELGSLVQAKVEKSKATERFQGKIGVMTTSNDGYFLVISSHVLTQALTAAKSDAFPGNEWVNSVTIISGNGGKEIGKVSETFDPQARTFPHGFLHDVSLVNVTYAPMHLVSGIKAPLPAEWLSQAGWSKIKYTTQTLFLLDSPQIQSKSIGILGSQCQMVGQGIFRLHSQLEKKARFKFSFGHKRSNSASVSTTPETWTSLVSRSVLYRVDPDFRTPGAQSGTAVCVHEESEDKLEVVKIAGFSSFAQQVSDVQRFDMEGKKFYNRLEEGRVAFYGALQAPEKLRDEHAIA